MALKRLDLRYSFASSKMFLEASLGTELVPFLIDTGANASMVPFGLVRSCGAVGNVEETNDMRLETPVGSYEPKILGRLKTVIVCQGVELASEFFVLDRSPPLLGLDFMMSYKSTLHLDPFYPFMEVELHRLSASPDSGLRDECKVAERKLVALVDTGATACFINLETVMALGLHVEDLPDVSFNTLAGASELFGYVPEVRILFRGQEFVVDLLVERSTDEITLGLNLLLGYTISFAQS